MWIPVVSLLKFYSTIHLLEPTVPCEQRQFASTYWNKPRSILVYMTVTIEIVTIKTFLRSLHTNLSHSRSSRGVFLDALSCCVHHALQLILIVLPLESRIQQALFVVRGKQWSCLKITTERMITLSLQNISNRKKRFEKFERDAPTPPGTLASWGDCVRWLSGQTEAPTTRRRRHTRPLCRWFAPSLRTPAPSSRWCLALESPLLSPHLIAVLLIQNLPPNKQSNPFPHLKQRPRKGRID